MAELTHREKAVTAGHRHHHDNQCIQEALVKDRVLEQLDIVVQSCEALDTAQAILQ